MILRARLLGGVLRAFSQSHATRVVAPPPSIFKQAFWLSAYLIQVATFGHVFATYCFSAYSASGPSMLPTFQVMGDWLLVDKLNYRRGKDIKVGDVIAFKSPYNRRDAVKRVLGMPGDYVLMGTPGSGNDQMIQVILRPSLLYLSLIDTTTLFDIPHLDHLSSFVCILTQF
jgi:hypothetical protein